MSLKDKKIKVGNLHKDFQVVQWYYVECAVKELKDYFINLRGAVKQSAPPPYKVGNSIKVDINMITKKIDEVFG